MLAALLLAPLFVDHMVLQRDRANAVWGTDTPQHVVSLPVEGQVPAPQTVRDAWADCPDANLEDSAGLPAAPFRTDGY